MRSRAKFDSAEYGASGVLSAHLVEYLLGEGRTLKQVATLFEVSESYISRVSRAERGLTLAHIELLAKKLGFSLPVLFENAFGPLTPGRKKTGRRNAAAKRTPVRVQSGRGARARGRRAAAKRVAV